MDADSYELPPKENNKMNTMQLQQRFTREFIETYKNLPTLWDMTYTEYKNRASKVAAWDILTKKCQEFVEEADKDFAAHKISTMRSCYRKERNKVESYRRSGKLHVPTLWYYELLTFLDRNRATDESTEMSMGVSMEIDSKDMIDISEVDLKDPLSSSYPLSFAQKQKTITQPNIMGNGGLTLTNMSEMTDQNQSSEDLYDAIAKNVAHKLRTMTPHQRLFAEKIVNDTMYHGQMEMLTKVSRLTLNNS